MGTKCADLCASLRSSQQLRRQNDCFYRCQPIPFFSILKVGEMDQSTEWPLGRNKGTLDWSKRMDFLSLRHVTTVIVKIWFCRRGDQIWAISMVPSPKATSSLVISQLQCATSTIKTVVIWSHWNRNLCMMFVCLLLYFPPPFGSQSVWSISIVFHTTLAWSKILIYAKGSATMDAHLQELLFLLCIPSPREAV